MPIVTVDNNEQLLAEYQAAGESPAIFYFFEECNAMCDESSALFDTMAQDYAESLHVVRVIFTGHRIVEGTDFTVDELPTVIVGINGIESCEDKLVGADVNADRLQALFEKYSC